MNYAENLQFGYKIEEECSKLLQELYTEITIRRTDVTDTVKPREVMRDIPSQSNFTIFIRGEESTPVYGWCESTRKNYQEFLSYLDNMFVKYKTFLTMKNDHYLIKPLVRKADESIIDIVAIRRECMELRGSSSSDLGTSARVKVKNYHDLVRGRSKTAGTFLDALCTDKS